MDKPVIIIGAKTMGKMTLEIFESNQVVVYGFLDDDKSIHQSEIYGVSVMGAVNDEDYLKLIGKDCEVFISSDDISERRSLVKMFVKEYHVMPVNAVHKKAVIAKSTYLGHGNFVNAGVILGSGSKVGNHCILHTGCIMDSNASLGNYVQLGSGSIINSHVIIEEEVFVGSGVTIVSGITVGKGARIGAGSVVIENIESNQTVFGNPAKPV